MSSPLTGAVVLVTGGGSGIGAALARRAAAEGAAAVIVTDRDEQSARQVSAGIGALAQPLALDVADERQVGEVIAGVLARNGRVDVVFSNAGITTGVGVLDAGGPSDTLGWWQAAWSVNLLSHVYLARAVIPAMLDAGGGRFVITASAAGLLTSPGDAPYAVTKHAAVALAEWLAVQYGGDGIDVSVICPLGVATPLLLDPLAARQPAAEVVAASGAIIEADAVAEAVVSSLATGSFLILPHPEVAKFWQQKAADPQRWLAGVRRLADSAGGAGTTTAAPEGADR